VADDLATEVIADWERHDGDRGLWKSVCQQITNYMVPDRADYLIDRAPGQKRMQWIYDGLPILLIEQLAAGLHSRLTSSSMPWFALVPEDDKLAGNDSVRQWLQAAGTRLYTIFADPKRNFPTHSHELYLDLGSIGTGVMAVLDDPGFGPWFSTRHMKECCLVEGERDRIDQISRRWQWSAKKAWAQWGARAGETVAKACADGKETEKFWFHHRVKPRLDRDPQRADRRNMAWESAYVAEADKSLIELGGFTEFPYIAPRLGKVAGETNGRGRGHVMLPDVQMLNEMVKTTLKGAQKIVDPPLMMPDDGFMLPVKTEPGAFNYYRSGTRPTDRIAPIQTGGNPQLGAELIQALKQQLREEAYVNLMTTTPDPDRPGSEGKGVTATFTARQEGRDLQMLSPVLSRLSCEQNQPLVDRVFDIEFRRSVLLRFGPGSPFPPPPDALRSQRLKVVYLNPIALAQRASELSAVDQVVQRQAELKQLDPQSPTIIDAEAILRLEARDVNAPVEILKSAARLAQDAQAQAKMAAEQHEAAIAAQTAQAVQRGGAGVKSLNEAAMPQRMAA
jgi:hypothetical protein